MVKLFLHELDDLRKQAEGAAMNRPLRVFTGRPFSKQIGWQPFAAEKVVEYKN